MLCKDIPHRTLHIGIMPHMIAEVISKAQEAMQSLCPYRCWELCYFTELFRGEVYTFSIELVSHPINTIESDFTLLEIECDAVLPTTFKHLSQIYQQIAIILSMYNDIIDIMT
jgi:hypothetical protein